MLDLQFLYIFRKDLQKKSFVFPLKLNWRLIKLLKIISSFVEDLKIMYFFSLYVYENMFLFFFIFSGFNLWSADGWMVFRNILLFLGLRFKPHFRPRIFKRIIPQISWFLLVESHGQTYWRWSIGTTLNLAMIRRLRRWALYNEGPQFFSNQILSDLLQLF